MSNSNNLYFINIPFNNDVWSVPSILGSEPKEFKRSEVKSALKYAREECNKATVLAGNKCRYTPILVGDNRSIANQRIALSSATRSRINIDQSVVVYKHIFNIREKLAPDKEHRLYVGEIIVGGEVVDVYTNIMTRSIINSLPISPNAMEWKEGAFFRACDDLATYKPREQKSSSFQATSSPYSYEGGNGEEMTSEQVFEIVKNVFEELTR